MLTQRQYYVLTAFLLLFTICRHFFIFILTDILETANWKPQMMVIDTDICSGGLCVIFDASQSLTNYRISLFKGMNPRGTVEVEYKVSAW